MKFPFNGLRLARNGLLLMVAITLAGCASWMSPRKYANSSSVVQFLYGNTAEPPALTPGTATLRPPVKVGIAFVPGRIGPGEMSESDRQAVLGKLRDAFKSHDFVGEIEVIPSAYLRPNGGFANIDQVARMFNLDVVALMSYDQVQFNDASSLSLLYWTIIGAYVVEGDRYDIHTLLDLSVFDVRSRKLLMRAPGVSQVKGAGTAVSFSQNSREGRIAGFNQAVDVLIPNLQKELDKFPERLKADASMKVEPQAGYRGKGAFEWGWLLALGSLAALGIFAGRARRVDS